MRKLFVLVISIAFVISCQKEESPIPTVNKVQSNYYPLDIGNYWVYRHYVIDTLGNEKELPYIDSVVIIKDTIIRNNRWFVQGGKNIGDGPNFIPNGILRDSMGYIVTPYGRKILSKDNFKDTLDVFHYLEFDNGKQDTAYTGTTKMEQTNEKIKVPAGEFNVINCKCTISSTKRKNDIRYKDAYYADKVGQVQYSYFYFSRPEKYEVRLIRYHVKQ
jgi:hypothetical protein